MTHKIGRFLAKNQSLCSVDSSDHTVCYSTLVYSLSHTDSEAHKIDNQPTAPDRPLDLLCLGEPLYEFNQRDDGLFETGHGGDTSNCAIAAARCGAKSAMLTHLGDDAFARSFLTLWEKEGVNTDAVRLMPDRETGVYFVNHDENGHHYTYRRQHSAASRLTSADINPELIGNSKILHVSGISQAISATAAEAVLTAIGHANDNNTLVSYDTNLRTALLATEPSRELFHTAIKQCDIVLPGYDDAVELTRQTAPDAIVDFYLNLGSRIVALTLGADGVLIATTDGRRRLAAHTVNYIDANGAGDTFDGAFLSAYSGNRDVWAAAEFANAAAALSTTRSGAVRSMPTKSEVESFLHRKSDQ